MEYLKGIDSFSGLVSIYSFDILPDGSFGEIRIMQVNNANHNVLVSNPVFPGARIILMSITSSSVTDAEVKIYLFTPM